MGIKERINRPKPRFFEQLSKFGLVVAAVGGVIVSAPVLLPVTLIKVGGYLVVAGGVISAVSELSVSGE